MQRGPDGKLTLGATIRPQLIQDWKSSRSMEK
jgi:hypothetical protein